MLELNKVYCMDALELLKQLPDKSVDLCLIDPPYGIGEKNIQNNKSRTKLAKATDWKDNGEWDNQIPSKEVFDEIFRVSKNQIIFGGNYMIEYLKNSSCWIVWDKDNGDNDFADCELAWTSFNSAVRKFKWRWNGMLQEKMNWKEKRLHPTQKPIALFRWIIEKYSNEGDVILDCYSGSGTTALASKQLGREFICCDISQEYVNIANKRLNQNTLNSIVAKEDRKVTNGNKQNISR